MRRNPVSNQRKSSCEVSNKTYRLWDSYKITPDDIKALAFSKLSIQIGLVHFIEMPCRKMADIEDLHPNSSTDLSAFSLGIRYQNL